MTGEMKAELEAKNAELSELQSALLSMPKGSKEARLAYKEAKAAVDALDAEIALKRKEYTVSLAAKSENESETPDESEAPAVVEVSLIPISVKNVIVDDVVEVVKVEKEQKDASTVKESSLEKEQQQEDKDEDKDEDKEEDKEEGKQKKEEECVVEEEAAPDAFEKEEATAVKEEELDPELEAATAVVEQESTDVVEQESTDVVEQESTDVVEPETVEKKILVDETCKISQNDNDVIQSPGLDRKVNSSRAHSSSIWTSRAPSISIWTLPVSSTDRDRAMFKLEVLADMFAEADTDCSGTLEPEEAMLTLTLLTQC